ncbi:MAG: cysteine desulfurase [Immundisolibacterales bacterium]|nr:cysteine desulfurase [Immundisolibacterales bacterium]
MSSAMRTDDTAAFDVEAVRADFPALDQEVNGHPLAYLDNGATSQKPRAVIEALRDYYERDNSNVHRGVHTLSERATAAYEGTREKVRSFLNAPSEREIVFARGTTEAINLVANGFVRPRLREGDEIVISHMEHHSNIVPWQMLRDELGAKLRVVPIDDDGALDLDAYLAMLGPRTRFVSMTHVANSLGTVNPVREIVEAAHAVGAQVLLDSAQAVPHLAVDVQALDCDFLAFSAHKVLGPTGIGALYGRMEHLESMVPWQGGGDMILAVTFEKATWNAVPYRFEAGTPNIADTIAMGVGLDYLREIGLDRVAAWEHDLLAYADERVRAIPGVRIFGDAPEKSSILSFVIEGVHAHDVGTILDSEGVAVRTGHHCTMPVMARFDVPAMARASLAFYNTRGDIDALARGIEKVRDVFRLNR